MDPFKKSAQAHLLARNQAGQAAIEQADKDMVNSYPEHVFIQYFLPMFSGQVEQNTTLLEQWRQIAGDLSRPVNLTNAQNEVVIQVPALQPRSAMKPLVGSTGLDYNLSLIEKGVIHNPDQSIYVTGMDIHRQVLQGGDTAQEQQAWVALLAHYGKGTVQAVQEASDDDIYDY
jgi:hypothetical protein